MIGDKRARDLARLEQVQRRTEERLELERLKINKRFDRMRQKLQQQTDPGDTQQRIIHAALELLKQDGLANISLRKLAGMVDMQAPALYWYFKSKEELVDYMAEAILQKEFHDLRPRQDDESWQDWLTETMVRLRGAMLAYPDGARTVAGAHFYPAVTLAQLAEVTLHSLESAGVDLEIAHHIVVTATNYTFGYVIEEQAAPTREELRNLDLTELMRPYPTLAKLMTDMEFTHARMDKNFLVGLGYIITGGTAN